MCSRFDTIPACADRQTDGWTDGIAVASTALAMRRAVKKIEKKLHVSKLKPSLAGCGPNVSGAMTPAWSDFRGASPISVRPNSK